MRRVLTRYTENGVLVADNNLLESAIRPIAMGCKSYLFTASERGGHVAATLYSLVGTRQLNRIERYAHLKDGYI
jgi:transposase